MVSERTACEDCGAPLRVQWTSTRRPLGILLGEPRLRHRIKGCPRCGRVYRSEDIDLLVPPAANYAYDVIAEVGAARFLHRRQNQEIVRIFAEEHGRSLPPGAIHHLAHAFLDGLAAVHEQGREAIAGLIARNGGWVCHLDGTCEAGTDVLFAVIDGITGLTLDTARMPTENAADIKEVVDRCVGRFGPPLAVVCDLSQNIARAVAHLPESVRRLDCQYHFLENVGDSLTARHHAELSRLLRGAKICPRLRSLRRDLVRYSRDADPVTPAQFERLLGGSPDGPPPDPIQLRRHIAYLLLRWQADYAADLTGERLPFDQPALALYRRCEKLYRALRGLLARHPGIARAHPTLASICQGLAPVCEDAALAAAAARLQKAVDMFAELREALRFGRQDGAPVRRDRGPDHPPEAASQVESRLDALRDRLAALAESGSCPETRHDARTVLKHLDARRDRLSGHLIDLPGRERPVLVACTNAICEQRFGQTKSAWRRRTGTKKLARLLQAARHEELLVHNLTDEHYVRTLYGGSLDNMPDAFARAAADAQRKRAERRDAADQRVMPVPRKTLRAPRIVERITGMIRRLFGRPA